MLFILNLAISAIPKIVCETIHALELQDETPSWKIMDNKGRITVVLHWDQRQQGGGQGGSSLSNGPTSDKFSPSKKNLSTQNSIDKSEQHFRQTGTEQRYPSPQITVINHDDPQSQMYHSARRLSKQGGSFDSAVGAIHIHTPECAHHAHTPR